MHCFIRVVESGSFSAVAREMGVGQPNVSRYIAGLEQHLDARLLNRSTRNLSLTPEGERYYAEARQVLDAVAEAESNARGENSPRGLLRVSCPSSIGSSILVPLIGQILERYPLMQVDLRISDRFLDLVAEGIDVALRVGVLADSELRARRIGTAQRVCVASPAYLAQFGTPLLPQDLLRHNCIRYTLLSSGNLWSFRDAQVKVTGNFLVNAPDAICSAAIDARGVAYGPSWIFEQALSEGRLLPLLGDHAGAPAPVNIVYPAVRYLPRRSQVFMDFIAQEFSLMPSMNTDARTCLPETDGGHAL